MIIVCSNCQKQYNVDPSKIPTGMTSIKCKACGHPISSESLFSQFTLTDKVCSKCGYQRQAKDDYSVPTTECPNCGIIYKKYKDLLATKKVKEEIKKEQKLSSELKQAEKEVEAKGQEDKSQIKEKISNLEKEKKSSSSQLIYIDKSKLLFIGTMFLCLVFGYFIGREHVKYTPEQKQLVANLKQELSIVRQNINEAKKADAIYSGGFIKNLIAVRLEVLKTNEALVEQRINAIESGAKITVVLNESKADPVKAAEIKSEIETQKAKLSEAQAESDRYSGGLVKSLADTSVATVRNTLAMLEQQYLVAQYGIVIQTAPVPDSAMIKPESMEVPKTTQNNAVSADQTTNREKKCLKIETLDSSVLSTNNVFTELAWKVDVSNLCDKPFGVRIKFTIYDKDDFELDSDSKDVYVPPNDIGKARGKMLVSPPAKASRMAKQSASILQQ